MKSRAGTFPAAPSRPSRRAVVCPTATEPNRGSVVHVSLDCALGKEQKCWLKLFSLIAGAARLVSSDFGSLNSQQEFLTLASATNNTGKWRLRPTSSPGQWTRSSRSSLELGLPCPALPGRRGRRAGRTATPSRQLLGAWKLEFIKKSTTDNPLLGVWACPNNHKTPCGLRGQRPTGNTEPIPPNMNVLE